MKIAVIGTGNVGSALGNRWAKGGHQVIFGTRDPTSEKVQALLQGSGPNACAAGVKEAAASAEVIAFATPWGSTQAAIQTAGDLMGKIVIDCTNPIAADGGLALGHTTSGGEQVAIWATGARVVKAFNTTGAGNMINSDYGASKPTMFICGDDVEAKKLVAGLAEELGFEAIDSGPLAIARYLEPLTMLWVYLAYVQKLGPNIAFKLIKR